MVGIDIASKR
jgi:hypothetical protein